MVFGEKYYQFPIKCSSFQRKKREEEENSFQNISDNIRKSMKKFWFWILVFTSLKVFNSTDCFFVSAQLNP